jgi:RNA polymerase sigma-70 factor (ECF subfamily)
MNEEPLITTFIQLRKSFLKLASRFLPNEEDASDALQDAFCRLWPQSKQIHSSEVAKALAITTIRNLCIDQVRKNKPPLVELDAERDSTPTETIEEKIERKELFREVEELIERQLSPAQKLILRKREYEELSIEEIAKELDMQQAAVRSQLSRARKKIRECYRNRHSHEE